jgi:hypothetical protein
VNRNRTEHDAPYEWATSIFVKALLGSEGCETANMGGLSLKRDEWIEEFGVWIGTKYRAEYSYR